jgi:hypothetical protein
LEGVDVHEGVQGDLKVELGEHADDHIVAEHALDLTQKLKFRTL